MRWWTGFLSNFGMVMMNCFRYSFWYGSLVRRKLVCTFLYNLFCPSLCRLVLSYPQRVRRRLTYWLIFVQRIFSFFLSIILICAYHIKEGNMRHLSDQQASTALRAARSIFVHAPGILNFHGDTHKLDSSNSKALVLTHFLAHLRCAH